MKYILLVICTYIPYLLFPLGALTAVLIIRHFILTRSCSSKGSNEVGDDVRIKKWNSTLNAIMITSVAITMFRAIVDYIYLIILRPDRYAMTSFPWYTNSLLYAAVTLVLMLVCAVIKLIIKYKNNKTD